MDPNGYLSPHFRLQEFLTSQTAARHGIDMTPSTEVVQNLTRLCTLLLEPIRATLGIPLQISSGYRPPLLNQLIGGASNSAHQFGCAADVIVAGRLPADIQRLISKMPCSADIDQCIEEFGQWTHVAVADATKPPRRQYLSAKRDDSGVHYYPAQLS